MTQTFLLPKEPTARAIVAEKLRAFVIADHPGSQLEVVVKVARKTRSNQQNRALWGVAYKTLADATGNDPEDLHQMFLGEYFGWDMIEVMGQKRRIPKRRSHDMTTTEFADFYTFIQRRSAEMGFNVPDPNE